MYLAMTFHVQDDAVDATGAEMQLFTDFSHSHGTCAQAGDNAVPILESQSIHGHPNIERSAFDYGFGDSIMAAILR